MKHNVSVPKAFFQKAKLDYANWRFAFFREIIQNAVDAGATTILFYIEQIGEICQISVEDNGHGMTREVLIDKFMALRATSKDSDENSTGGFGVAKEIIVFCHDRYVIETRGTRLEGVAGQYDYWDAETPKGVQITVDMTDVSADRMGRELRNWCSLSKIKAKVCLNGEVLPGSDLKLKYQMAAPFGNICFKDNSDSADSWDSNQSTLIVKMNGMAMFVRELYTHGGSFIAELDLQGSSVELLTSNRDGLSGHLESTLSDILNQLANDRSKLKLSKPVNYEFNNFWQEQSEFTRSTNPGDLQQAAHERAQETAKAEAALAASRTQESKNQANGPEKTPVTENDIENFQRNRRDLTENLARTILHKEFKAQETTLNRIENAIGEIHEEGFPNNWVVRVGQDDEKAPQTLIKRLNMMRYRRLAHSWKMIISYMVANLPFFKGQVDRRGNITVMGKAVKCGFVIDSVEAVCVEEDDCYMILVNPFKCEEDYAEDFVTLVEVACHECAHIFSQGHTEHMVNILHLILKRLRKAVRNDTSLSGHGLTRLENAVHKHLKVVASPNRY